jgi:hypothetical protein
MVKQMKEKHKDIVGSGGVKDASGRVETEEVKVRGVWEKYFNKLLNEEFDWDKTSLEACTCNVTGCDPITEEEVKEAIINMKKWKAAGPTGVTIDLLRAAGIEGIKWLTEVCNAVIRDGRIPDDWKNSWITAVYKGKGDAMECSSYRGIKLLEHAMKVMERVLEARLRKCVEIDDMQFGFTSGRGTTDAIFILRQLQEKFLAKKRELWLAFVDLEKAFDRVPREVVWWALRYMGVGEGVIQVIKSMYDGVKTSVRCTSGQTELFEVKVGLHQGSVLSPLLFIIVMEALSRKFRGSVPWELLYADDLVLVAETKEDLLVKVKAWKDGLESKGLRVNVSKTKVMHSVVDSGRQVDSGKYPCGICRSGVGSNSIFCGSCKHWIHYRCSGVKGRLKDSGSYICPKCAKPPPGNAAEDTAGLVMADGTSFELVDQFCYLGDMVGAGGGASDASRARVRCGWKKFHELAPVLTLRGASLKMKGKIYSTCVRTSMVYGSETWAIKVDDLRILERAEKMMMRRMCGVRLQDRVAIKDLYAYLYIDSIADVVTRGRLRWFGHVQRMPDTAGAKRVTDQQVEGPTARGRPRKTWRECVDDDLARLRLDPRDAMRREWWRQQVGLKV